MKDLGDDVADNLGGIIVVVLLLLFWWWVA